MGRPNRVLIPPMAEPPSRPPSDLIWTLGGDSMGTTWSAKVIPPPGADQAAIDAVIRRELDIVLDLFSPWEPTSEISGFNAAAPGLVAMSPEFWAVLDASLDIADDTDGAVDPTLGALVDLWGFGPPGPRAAEAPLPADDEVEAARELGGWQALRLDRDARKAVQPGGMRLDFSGIAKGHAVDRVSEALSALGATSHLIEIGGELRGRGVKPDGQPWWVEIEQPPNSHSPRTLMAMIDIAMATSGDYRRAFVHDGHRYSHTLDGATGRPVANALASVTVVHPSAMKADAYATALTVMGPFDGPEFAEAFGLAALFVERTPRGPIERMTPLFAAMLDDASSDAPLQ